MREGWFVQIGDGDEQFFNSTVNAFRKASSLQSMKTKKTSNVINRAWPFDDIK